MEELKNSGDSARVDILDNGGNDSVMKKYDDNEKIIEEKAIIAKEEYENSFITPGVIESQIAEKNDDQSQTENANSNLNKAEDAEKDIEISERFLAK